MDPQSALDEIRSCSGTQFDPEMAAALCASWRAAGISATFRSTCRSMREAPRTKGRRGPERRFGVRRGGARLKAVLLIAVAAIIVLALEIVVNRESSGEDSTALAAPPEELVGTWVTEDPRYSGSALVIGFDHIELDPGEEGEIRSHPILSIRAVQGRTAGRTRLITGPRGATGRWRSTSIRMACSGSETPRPGLEAETDQLTPTEWGGLRHPPSAPTLRSAALPRTVAAGG